MAKYLIAVCVVVFFYLSNEAADFQCAETGKLLGVEAKRLGADCWVKDASGEWMYQEVYQEIEKLKKIKGE